jgi:hypothetical protein
MSQRSDYDAIKVAIEAEVRAGRRPVFTEIARRVGCNRTTVSRLVNHGLKPNATSAGAPALLPLIKRPTKHASNHTADGLRDQLFRSAVRAADRADNTLADPEAAPAAVDQAVKIVVALAGVADKLDGRAERGPRRKDKGALPDAPAAPPAPAAGPTEEETRAHLDAVAATLGDGDEPGAEVTGKEAA